MQTYLEAVWNERWGKENYNTSQCGTDVGKNPLVPFMMMRETGSIDAGESNLAIDLERVLTLFIFQISVTY